MNQKGLSLILIIMLIAAAIGGYLLFSGKINLNGSKSAPVQTTQPTQTDETANWKTYTNAEKKFSLNYPNNLQVKENDLGTYKSIIFLSEYKPPFSNYFNFGILTHIVENNTDLDDWVNDYVVQDLPSGKRGSIVSGSINQYKNNSIEGLYFIGGKESENKYIFFQNKNLIYEIILSGSGTGSSYKENPNSEKLLDQILSTFKFLDQNQVDTSNWKTYTNETYAFQIKYPSTGGVETNARYNYSYLSILSGCVKVYALVSGYEKSGFVGSAHSELTQLAKVVPWEKLEELSKLEEGQSKTYTVNNTKESTEYTYKKLPINNIGGFGSEFNKNLSEDFKNGWSTFFVTTNRDVNYQKSISYINKGGNLYVIERDIIPACEWPTNILHPLHTFRFTN